MPIAREPINALSRAKAQVSRELACTQAFKANRAISMRATRKTVAAMCERVAWIQIS